MTAARGRGDRSVTLRRRRRLVASLAAVGCVVLGAVLAGAVAGPGVGHFRSAADRERYLAAYAEAMTALPAPSQVRDLPTSFGTVRVYRFDGAGEGAPILALPGTSSGVPVLADNLPGLLEHRDVYALDLLGEPGLSVQGTPVRSAAEQAAWLHEVLAQLAEPAVHLVGLSIGGWTAVNLAVHDPSHIASITLVDSPLVVSDLSWQAVLRSIPLALPFAPRSWRDSFASWTAGGAPVADVPVAEMIEAGMSAYAMALPTPARIPEDDLLASTVPMMMVVAGDSRLHDPVAAAESAARLLDQVHVYDGASHAVNGEQPDRLAADVGSFVDAHEPG